MASWQQWGGDQEDEEEDEHSAQRTKDYKIFLIDAHMAMAMAMARTQPSSSAASSSAASSSASTDGPLSCLDASLRCAAEVMKNKIITSPDDQIGVVLYGTKESKAAHGGQAFPGVYVLLDLDIPDASRIKQLLELGELTEVRDSGHSDAASFPFHTALWACQTMFSNATAKNIQSTVLVFTNSDDPSDGDQNLVHQALTKAKDCHEIGIAIDVYSLPKSGGSEFRPQVFFRDLVDAAMPEDEVSQLAISTNFEELIESVKKKQNLRRAMGSFTLHLDDSTYFAVTKYSLVMRQTVQSAVQLEAATNKPVKTETSYVCEETGEVLMDSQIGRGYDGFGGEMVVLSTHDVEKIKDFGPPGLRLMGFKPASEVSWEAQIKHADFLFPEEELVKGSTRLFHALLQRMAERKSAMIARFIPRKFAPPRMVALLPQLEELDEKEGLQTQPPGLHMIHLPWADDVRQLNGAPADVAPTEQQVAAAKQMIRAQTIVNPGGRHNWNFPNPALNKHYENLQVMALDQPVADEVADFVKPAFGGPEGQPPPGGSIERAIQQFKEGTLGSNWESVTEASKPKAKPRAVSKAVGGINPADYDWDNFVSTNTLIKLTVPKLKSYLAHFQLPQSGAKGALIERITEHNRSHPGAIQVSAEAAGTGTEEAAGTEAGGGTDAGQKRPREADSPPELSQSSPALPTQSLPASGVGDEGEDDVDSRPNCQYGASCYRQENAEHTARFRHDGGQESAKRAKD